MVLNEVKILEAIEGTGLSPETLEEGARLVDHWVSETLALDEEDETLGVEEGFYLELDPLTFVVGTQDRVIRRRTDGKVCGCEWKTTKGKTKYWNAEEWLTSISGGHQIVTYAAGIQRGTFLNPILQSLQRPGESEILVRAVTKSHPPELWPSPRGQFVKLTNQQIEGVLNAYKNTAAKIRAAQGTGLLPWQVPGLHCTNMFRKECPFLSSCKRGELVKGELNFKSFSPGSQKVVQHLIEQGKVGPQTVILSASTLSNYQQCAELWRRMSLKDEADQDGEGAVGVGTVLHAGVAEVYRQLMKKEDV